MKNYLIMGGIALGVVILWLAIVRPVQQIVHQTTGGSLGSVASPDILSPYYSVGGLRVWKQRTDSLIAATTTICALQSPISTSTLVFASYRVLVGTTTNTRITIAKATTGFATTTEIGGGALGAGAQGTFVASTSPVTGTSLDGPMTFAPSNFVVVGVANAILGATGVGYAPTGVCEAQWVEN